MLSSRSISIRDCICNRDSSLAIGIIVVLLIHGSVGQDFAFPDENLTEVLQRIRLTSESATTKLSIKCGDNMILDRLNGTENFCECLQGYLYYPKHEKCYGPYTRGPCDDGKFIVLRANETIAECIVNPCKTYNEIPYEGSCYDLLSSGGLPCPTNETLMISEKSYEPTCEIIGTSTYQVITAPIKPCAPGSRRIGSGMCREVLFDKTTSRKKTA